MLLLTSNKSPAVPGEYEATILNGTNRFVIDLEGRTSRGALMRVLVNFDAKSGTNGTDIDTYVLDSNLLTESLEANSTVFSSQTDLINGATVPDLVVNQVCPEEIYFVTKDKQASGTPAPGQVQIVIVLNGGDGTTSHTATIQLYGEAHA